MRKSSYWPQSFSTLRMRSESEKYKLPAASIATPPALTKDMGEPRRSRGAVIAAVTPRRVSKSNGIAARSENTSGARDDKRRAELADAVISRLRDVYISAPIYCDVSGAVNCLGRLSRCPVTQNDLDHPVRADLPDKIVSRVR